MIIKASSIQPALSADRHPASSKLGFSLIELLIVIAMIGLLSSLLLANLQGARARARDAQRKSDLKQLKTALRMYYNDNQAYPLSDDTNHLIDGYDWSDQFSSTTVYMKNLPMDPIPTQDYYYSSSGDESFDLYGCLENAGDSDGGSCPASFCTTTNKCFHVSED